jgi:hypothetical protein
LVRGPREPIVPTPTIPDVGAGSTYPIYPYQQPTNMTVAAPVTPAGPAAFAGSPLNTLYGIDSESYLTEDQRKLARMIQGKFDASLNRRDRELAQYGAPQLSSFAEDEALARAMSLARGLNIPVRDALGMVQGSGPASRGGSGSGGGGAGGGSARAPALTAPRQSALQRNPTSAAAKTTPPGATQSQFAKWQQLLGGLSSVLPLLLGRNAMGAIEKQGIFGWLKNQWNETFPEAASNGTSMSDEMLDKLLDSQGANDSWDILPPAIQPLYGDYTPDQLDALLNSQGANNSWDILPPAAGDTWVGAAPEVSGYEDLWGTPEWGMGDYWSNPEAWWSPEAISWDAPAYDTMLDFVG